MKLDRHNGTGACGKYALIKVRQLNGITDPEICNAVKVLDSAGLIEWGRVGDEDEFFVIKLKDINAGNALLGYAASAEDTDPELAADVNSLRTRAGHNSPFCKIPD